jgi:hypothetical protein
MRPGILTLITLPLLMVIGMAKAQSISTVKEVKTVYSIQITLGERVITGQLNDTPSVRDFIKQLPLTLDLEDHASTEKIAYLPNKLTSQGAPAGVDPDVGDISYHAPWGNLAIYYKDFGYSKGLIRLGRISGGLEHLRFPGSQEVIISLIPNDKTTGAAL